MGMQISNGQSRRLHRLACLIGGVCLGLSFPPFGFTPLGWFSLAPAFIVVLHSDRREAFVNAWLLYLACFSVAFYWPLLHVRTETSVVSAVAWIANTMLHAVPFGLAAIWRVRSSRSGGIWAAGALVLLSEWLLTSGPIPMPWSLMGNTQAASIVMLTPVRYIGVSGLSVLVVLANMGFALAFVSRGKRRILITVVSAILPLVTLASGLVTHPASANDESPLLRVGIIQPGFTPEYWANVSDVARVDSLITISKIFLDNLDSEPDLLIWPETALPVDTSYFSPEGVLGRVSSWTMSRNLNLLTGAVTDLSLLESDIGPEQSAGFENSVILFRPDGTHRRFAKNILVPFAEHVPFSEHMPFLESLAVEAGGVSGYVPGSQPSVFSTGQVTFGVLICFESVFPFYAREMRQLGAELLVVVTQDGWWKGEASYLQHLYFNRIRAIELGLPVVQASVDGISALILPGGDIQGKTRSRSRATAVFDVPSGSGKTVYSRFGDTPTHIVLGIWILFSLLHGFRTRRPSL